MCNGIATWFDRLTMSGYAPRNDRKWRNGRGWRLIQAERVDFHAAVMGDVLALQQLP